MGWRGGRRWFFYTPPKSSIKEYSSCNLVVKTNQTHLQVHGYVHLEIVKKLFEFETFPSIKSPSHKQSPSKKKLKSIIKALDRQQVFKRLMFDDDQGRGHRFLPHIANSDCKNTPTSTSMQTPSRVHELFQVVKVKLLQPRTIWF